jgi:hypothetical protein
MHPARQDVGEQLGGLLPRTVLDGFHRDGHLSQRRQQPHLLGEPAVGDQQRVLGLGHRLALLGYSHRGRPFLVPNGAGQLTLADRIGRPIHRLTTQ